MLTEFFCHCYLTTLLFLRGRWIVIDKKIFFYALVSIYSCIYKVYANKKNCLHCSNLYVVHVQGDVFVTPAFCSSLEKFKIISFQERSKSHIGKEQSRLSPVVQYGSVLVLASSSVVCLTLLVWSNDQIRVYYLG